MTGDDEGRDFFRRWSRLKTEARDTEARASQVRDAVRTPEQEAAPGGRKSDVVPEQAPAVPPVESLNLDSDYRPFFHPKIEEGVRRAALKKLFSDPHFNVMDGLDTYIDDYSKPNPLPEGMLEQLEQAKKILAWSREDAEERRRVEAAAEASTAASVPAGNVTASQQGPAVQADSAGVTTAASEGSEHDSTRRSGQAE